MLAKDATAPASPLLKNTSPSPLLKPTASPAPAAPPPIPQIPQAPALKSVLGKDFGLAEFKRNTWRVELSPDQTIDDTADPKFFRNQVGLVIGHNKTGGRGDLIEVWKPDTSELALLVIVEIGVGYIRTTMKDRFAPEEVEIPDGVPFITRWNVGRRAHEVLRKADDAVMASNFQTKASALAWISQHMKAMAA